LADHDLIIAKAALVRNHIERTAAEAKTDVNTFLNDYDRQDVVAFNLHLAIENSIDIAAHIISENGWGMPGSASGMFYVAEKNGLLDAELTKKKVNAVGPVNRIVHE